MAHVFSEENQDALLKYADLEKSDFWKQDAEALGVYEVQPDGTATIAAVFVVECIKSHTLDLHFRTAQTKRWATRQVLQKVSEWVFQDSINRVQGVVGIDNKDMHKIAARLGFMPEGRMRDGHGRGCDAILYAITREDCRWLP